MPRIYISYRPEDSSRNEVRIIRQNLINEFGDENVLQSTGSNTEITTHLQRLVRSCDVLLIVIGRYWLDMVDVDGKLLLNDPYDPIHVEIDTGLKTLMVIKILVVDSSPIPTPEKLPDNLVLLLEKDILEAPDHLKLNRVLAEFAQEIAHIPSGSMADEHDIEHELDDQIIYTAPPQVTAQPRRWSNQTSSMTASLYIISIIIGVFICSAVAIIILLASNDQNPFSHPVRFNSVASSEMNAIDVGFDPENGYQYAEIETNDESRVLFTDPDNPFLSVQFDTSLEDIRASIAENQLDDDQVTEIEARYDGTIVFSSKDEDDNLAIAVTENATALILDLDTLELQSIHRLHYTSVRKIIPNETLVYNEATNLLMLLIGSNEINTWEIGGNRVAYRGKWQVESDSSYIYEIDVDRTGKYLVTRGEDDTRLFDIILP